MTVLMTELSGIEAGASPFELDVRIVTDRPGDTTPGCSTENGCAATCASSCASRG